MFENAIIVMMMMMIMIMQVRLEGPTRVQWSGVVSVPIKVLIANSDWNKSVRVTFETLSSFSLPVLPPPPCILPVPLYKFRLEQIRAQQNRVRHLPPSPCEFGEGTVLQLGGGTLLHLPASFLPRSPPPFSFFSSPSRLSSPCQCFFFLFLLVFFRLACSCSGRLPHTRNRAFECVCARDILTFPLPLSLSLTLSHSLTLTQIHKGKREGGVRPGL
jgi:hypothetical protein